MTIFDEHRRVFKLVSLLASIFLLSPAQIRILENGQSTPSGLDAGIFMASPARFKVDLSGQWSVSTGNEEWQKVQVPASIDESGSFTFRRTFTLTDDQIAKHAFKFVAYGINHDAEIFVNDIYIGRHIGGYTSCEFDVPDNALASGNENAIQIVVHNNLSARATVPVRKFSWGWRNYGGITRDLFLLGTPRLWIDGSAPKITFNEQSAEGHVEVQTTLSNRGFAGLVHDSLNSKAKVAPYLFTLELVDQSKDAVVAKSAPQVLVLEPNKDLEVQTALTIPQARVWRPDQPDLYTLRSIVYTQEGNQRVTVDQVSRTVGFASVTIRKGQLFENGARLRLRGVTWHEDVIDHGASLTTEQMERDMATIKSLGANAVRFAFHPPHPYVMELCARYGLYALVELPVWNVPSAIVNEESFKALVEPIAREMVERDRANPAVLAWGIGDQLDADDGRVASYVKDVAALVKSLDARPVYAGIEPIDQDATAAHVDFAAIHVSASDLKEFRAELQNLRTTYADRPLIVLSYGVPVSHDNRNGYRDPLSQEFQARYYLQHVAAIKDLGLTGGFVAAFADWKGDRPVLSINSTDRTIHPLGLVSRGREKRLAFDVVRAQYQEEKFPAIPAGNYRPAFPAANVITGLVVIILFGYLYSYNRRFGESVKRSMLRSFNFFADLRDGRDAPMGATALLALCLALTVGVVLASILYHFRPSVHMDALLNAFVVSDAIKNQIIIAAWNPVRGIAVVTAAMLVMFLLVTLLIKVIALLARVKIAITSAWMLTIWGSLPLIVLSPLGMSMFKIMEMSALVWPSIAIVVITVVWAGIRVLRAMLVVFDVAPARTYAIAIAAAAVLLAAGLLYLDSMYAVWAYVEHAFHNAGSPM